LAIASQQRLSESNGQETANTAWAFATVNNQYDKMFAALAILAGRRLSDFNGKEVANIARAFATVAIYSERRLSEFNTQGLANAAWACAILNKRSCHHNMGICDSQLSR
jgi:hypothetical protein